MEKPPPDRRGVTIIIALILCVVSVPLVIHLASRGSSDTASGKEDDWEWKAAKDNLFSIDDLGLDARAEVKDTPEPVATAAVVPRPGPPEPRSPVPDTATATAERVKTPPKKAKSPSPRVASKVKKPAKTDGENRYFTLELSGSLGGAALSRDDSQTWARLSYFVRQEARRPHFLVYPDGSVPMAMPAKVNGKPAPERAADEDIEPGGDPDEPAYRIVIQAAASQGQGVTFLKQRLASTFRCRVNCRIDRRAGDSWKAIGNASVEESFHPQDSGARTPAYLRQVYDASIEKLLKQLAGQPPFGGAPSR